MTPGRSPSMLPGETKPRPTTGKRIVIEYQRTRSATMATTVLGSAMLSATPRAVSVTIARATRRTADGSPRAL